MLNNTVPVPSLQPELEPEWHELPGFAPGVAKQRAARPRLRVVAGAQTAPAKKKKPMFTAIVLISILLLTMVAELGLSIANSQGAYDLRALNTEQRDLRRVGSLVQQNVEKLSSPQNLAANAQQLGMVQNVQPANLRLSDGAILGALDTKQATVDSESVPNSTLSDMPVINAKGMLVDRSAVAGATVETPKRWKGKLPVPDTH